jgi:hypothetical protein
MITYLVAFNWQQGNPQGPTNLFREEGNHTTINNKGKKHHTNKMAALHPRRHGLGANVSRVVLRAHMRHDTLAHGCRLPSNTMIAYAVAFILQHRLGMLGVISNAFID